VTVNSNAFTITVPALSTTAVLLKSTSSGITEHRSQTGELTIYPNPAKDQLHISLSSNIAERTQVTVFDQSGRKIQAMETEYDGASPIKTDVSSLPSGFYLLSVKNGHCTSTRSFIIVK